MSFFSRPNLDNVQFVQLEGTILALSGQTQIASWSGLTLTDGANGSVIITASGSSSGTTGYILTQDHDGIVKLMPSPISGMSRYYGASPTTCSLGGIVAGTSISGCTYDYIIEKLLVPSVSLTTSISIATPVSSTIRQFGDYDYGNLCWCVVKNTNPIENISLSTNGSGTYNCVLISGGSINATTGGTVSYTYPTPAPTSACTCHSVGYNICAISTENEISTSNAAIAWMNNKYYFSNSTLYNSSAIGVVLSATTGTLSTSKTLNLSQTLNNQFFYYAYPKTLGTPSFSVNGLPNNAWGNSTTGTLFTITYVNTDGFSNQYYVARSDSRITGTFCIIAT